MSFLGRIARQARSPVMPGHAVARPKGPRPSLPTMAAPADRPAQAEPVAWQAEPSVTAPDAVPPTIAGPSDEPPPAPSTSGPDTRAKPDQAALDQRLAAVAGASGTRPEAVDAPDFDRPELPTATRPETADAEAFTGRDQEPVVRVEAKNTRTVAPPADEQQDGGDRPIAVASAEETSASSPGTLPDQEPRLQPAEPAPADASIEQLAPVATEQAAQQAKSPSERAIASAGQDQGVPPAQPGPIQRAEDGTNAPRPGSPPVFEPVPAPQPEQYRPAPTVRPPPPEQPPLLQIDQIDVVVTDQAAAQPAAPARSRLAAVSASRRYLRRL